MFTQHFKQSQIATDMKLIITIFLLTMFVSTTTLQQAQQPLWCYIENCQLCDLSGMQCFYCLPNADCCSQNCTNCVDSTTCTACDQGFTLEQNLCLPNNSCTSQNETCSSCSNQTCVACVPGYWLSSFGNICLSCQPFCLNCTSIYVCQVCEPTYFIQAYMELRICISCSSFNCLECTDYLNCSVCLKSFYLTDNQTCQSCFPCSICDSLSNCTQCFVTYYLTNGTCQSCPQNCSTCADSQNCTGCLNGYYLNGSSCLSCSSPCDLCQFQGDNCTSCIDKYYLNVSSCLPCAQFCLDCTNLTQCNACSYAITNGTCCSQNCYQCQSIDLLFSSCTACLPGYFLNQTQIQVNSTNHSLFNCQACSQQCIECQSLTNCTICLPEYYLSATSQCILCSIPLPLCQICQNDTACIACKYGYISNGVCSCYSQQYFTGFSCKDCPNGCLTCTSQISCTSCQANYELQNQLCMTPSSSSFPWWAILIIVLVVVALVIVGGVCYRQYRKNNPADNRYNLLGQGQGQAGGEVIVYRRSSTIQMQ